jgi:hypothetical protein
VPFFGEELKPKATLIVSLPFFFFFKFFFFNVGKVIENYKKVKHKEDGIFQITVEKGLAAPPSVIG